MKKIARMLVMIVLFLSILPIFTLPARADAVEEFWVPLVFPQSWPGSDFTTIIVMHALQDSVVSVDGGPSISLIAGQQYTYSNPHVGTQIIVRTGYIIPFYFWMVNDYGIWDDCPLGYAILPSSKLGTKYLIPIGGLVSVVATQVTTTVNYSGAVSPITLASPGDNVQFESIDGGWVESDKPVAVAVGRTDSSTKSDSWAYAALPDNLTGTSCHFGKRVPMDPYFSNQIDLSKIGIMATDEGATISINGVVQPVLGPKEVKVISQPTDDISIISDKPINVVYLQRVQHSDPWNGETRYTSYAYSVIPEHLWGLNYISFGQLTHLITETDVNVNIGSGSSQHFSPGVYDLGLITYGTSITADKPVGIEQVGASEWSGVHYHAQGPGYEIFPIEFYQVSAPTPLTLSISPVSASIYIGDSVSFTSTVSGGTPPYSYQWYLNGVAVSGAVSPTWTFIPTSTVTYTVYLNVTDSVPNTAKSNEASVTVAPKLTVSISPTSASIPVGQSVTFTSTVSGGYTPYSYQWYLNGNPVSGATSASWTFTPTTSGIYYAYLKVTDAKANTAQSEAARIVVATVPVGGYSFPIQVHTKTEPVLPYIALVAALTAVFTKLRPKTKRKR